MRGASSSGGGAARLPLASSLPASVEPLDTFDESFDQLWLDVRASRRFGLCRRATHLNWRFVEAPSQRYRCFRLVEGQATHGYVVAGVIEKKGLRLGYLADLLLRPGFQHLESAALTAVEFAVRDQDVDAILSFTPPGWSSRARWLRKGFLPTPKTFFFIFKHFGPELPTTPFDTASCWHFELGDLDFF